MKEEARVKSHSPVCRSPPANEFVPSTREECPKVKVKRVESLFLITYSDIASEGVVELHKYDAFNVCLYIDIPTIDYYNDELKHNRLSRLNRRFKVHKLRELIFSSITNYNEGFWACMRSRDARAKSISFNFSVSSSGALRYVETIKYLIESCWEKLQECQALHVCFKLQVSPTSLIWFKTFLAKDMLAKEIVKFELIGNYNMITSSTTLFKEYYTRLNDKFTKKARSTSLDSIIIITNSTGVKALLTILSDKPLTSYLSQESLEALHSNALREKPPRLLSVGSGDSEDDTPLQRDSSSLLSFQNSLITSNKDKSVKIRTPALVTRGNQVSGAVEDSTSGTVSVAAFQEDSEGEDEDDEADNDEDGLSFSVPSRLSRCGSEVDLKSRQVEETSTTRRFRSLSLMDPALKAPFSQDVPSSSSRVPTSMETIEDEMCSPTANSLNKDRYTNIYVHDGQFEGDTPVPAKKPARKLLRSNSRNNSSNGLIPPEFYSRISSPSTSNSSSNTSLNNINILPGTFSKLLDSTGEQSNGESHSLFEKNLINKSFEEARKQPPPNFFHTLIGQQDMNRFALNFKSNKTIPTTVKLLDDEDRLMSGAGNYSSWTSDDDSKSNTESVTTLIAQDELSSSTSTTSKKLNLQIYDNPDDEVKSTPETEESKPKSTYKKPKFTLDLYNDDDVESNGGWLLGGNAR
ncbi:LAFE_0H06392g1_1 [Lachancea fermentati]|uniref:LAFE_0H06392g1_1 n=1 Tax=Lachancea fermentati TaxID=4955 RepID=A0A1G4MJV7_LACFM|nr:LAFE_0H06392g1_1 [Lachancea fermentati]